MKTGKYIGILAAVLVLMLSLSACGTDTTVESPSPSATATASAAPTVTPDSAEENAGDIRDPENSVDAGDNGVLGSGTEDEDIGSDWEEDRTGSAAEDHAADPDTNGTQPTGENAGDDLTKAGDDLADAARNAGRRVENSIRDMT